MLRRTYKPLLVLAVFASAFGFAMQTLAPDERTLGAVLRAQPNGYPTRPSLSPGSSVRGGLAGAPCPFYEPLREWVARFDVTELSPQA